ncbi:MAG: DMT family transporter [Gammaproteobacteria bacterium]|nr:DMT family transporter [Gammaproteobacteria bacterium]
MSQISSQRAATDRRLQFAHALLFIAPAMWSVNYIVARLANGVIEPHLLAFLRWLMAFMLMLPFAWSELRRLWPDWRREWPEFLFLGALGMWVCGAFVYIGGKTTQAINIGLLYALAPVLIAVFSSRLFDDKLRGWQIVGVVLALGGMVLIVAQGQLDNIINVVFTTGDLWVLFAVLCWTLYSLVLRKRSSVLGPFARLTLITFGGLIVLLPFTLIEAHLLGLPGDWPYALFLAVLVAVFPGFGAYQAYSFMQSQLGAARTGLVLYLGPVYAAVIAWIVLGEPPQWFHVVGALLILPGMYLATRSSTEPVAATVQESDSD